MALPSSGIIRASDIADEWSDWSPLLGTPVPQTRLSSYYKGGVNVPLGHIGAPNIPTSGTIRMSNFHGSSSEVSSAAHVWANRNRYVRTWAGTGWAGDTAVWNNPNQRYVSSITNTFNFANSDLPVYSKYYTVFCCSIGGLGDGGGITSLTQNNSNASLIQYSQEQRLLGDGAQPSNTGYWGLYYKTNFYKGDIRAVTEVTSTTTHGGGNHGAWQYMCLLPGFWQISSSGINENYNVVDKILSPGRIGFMIIERGGDGPGAVSDSKNPYQINYNAYWYNGGAFQMNVNPTSSNIAMNWRTQGYDAYNNPVGSPAAQWPMTEPPRVYLELQQSFV